MHKIAQKTLKIAKMPKIAQKIAMFLKIAKNRGCEGQLWICVSLNRNVLSSAVFSMYSTSSTKGLAFVKALTFVIWTFAVSHLRDKATGSFWVWNALCLFLYFVQQPRWYFASFATKSQNNILDSIFVSCISVAIVRRLFSAWKFVNTCRSVSPSSQNMQRI